jgi:trehalose 6-phosphate synthase
VPQLDVQEDLYLAGAGVTQVDTKTGALPMSRIVARYLALLLIGLAITLWISSKIVTVTTQQWFERDLALRSQLAVTSARASLIRRMTSEDPTRVGEVLDDIARDERIIASAMVEGNHLVAATSDYPPTLLGEDLGLDLDSDITSNAAGELGTRSIQITAVPVTFNERTVHVILLHDLSFVQRRQNSVDRFLWLSFLGLLVSGALSMFVGWRMSWSDWTRRLRRFVRGESREKMFQPLVTDLRDLAHRIEEHRGNAVFVPWTPARLRSLLNTEMMGERLIVLANREPYIHSRDEAGVVRIMHPASGLVTALQPVLRACSGTWVAHGSGVADREFVDANDRIAVPPASPEYTLRRVWLNEQEERGYYYGFANEGLWPLCHVAHVRPQFRKSDWEYYRAVNQRFADVVCEEADVEDPIILVQDYHFALAPKMIRERLPKASIISFWHIPWPNAERVGVCPWAAELIDGMLGSSIMGFHTQLHCNNFLDSVDRYLEARIDREVHGVHVQGRTCLVRSFPISIEWPMVWSPEAPAPEACRAVVFNELGLKDDAILGVGVDRLDYTKGILERFRAIEEAVARDPRMVGRLCFAQLSAPSRTAIADYQSFDREVIAEAERINERLRVGDWVPIRLLRAHHEPPRVQMFYRAADFCAVTSLHDGMNLVAKEFVASRADERGVLILSKFTGASKELTEALIVNPYDIEQSAKAISLAATMGAEEQRARMRAMRAIVAEFNVYAWAGQMLADASRLRWKERLTGRLSSLANP